MSDVITTCREALQDSNHPLHQAIWLLFGQRLNIKSADRLLGDQKETVIQLCFDILDTDDLYNESSLGSGNAPINAVKLLAHWQVHEVVPHLLRIIEEEGVETYIHNEAMIALEHWGPTILEDILRFAQTADEEHYPGIGAILSESGKGDARAFEWVKIQFDKQRDEHGIRYWAEMLLEVGDEAAITHLEENILKKRKHSLHLRNVLTNYIRNMREYGRP